MAQPAPAVATPALLYQGQPGTTEATIYTAPAYAASSPYTSGSTTIAKRAVICNTTGSVDTTLTAALVSGTAYTSLAVTALTAPVLSGDSVVLTSGTDTQTYVASAYAAVGATAISVVSLAANFAYPIGTTVTDTTQTLVDLTLYRVPSGGTAGIANMMLNGLSIPGGTTQILDLEQEMNPGDFLAALASVAAALTVTISGATFQ